jgi:site-specific recombinase XerD
VYNFIDKHWADQRSISFSDLSHKTAFLLAGKGIMRSSDLARISFSSIRFNNTQVTFMVKQPKESNISEPHRLVQLACTLPRSSCAVCTLRIYLARTNEHRDDICNRDHLFLSYDGSFTPVSSQRLAKWIVNVLQRAGIDTSIFKAHSVRSASATQLINQGVTVDQVMRQAHWRSRSVFTKFYDRSQR